MNSSRAIKVLVTGARGFVGSHLCESLLRDGAELHAVSQSGPIQEVGKHLSFAGAGRHEAVWWCADLSDPQVTQRLLVEIRPDVVFHLAGLVTGSRDREKVLPAVRDNFLSTVNLLNSASGTGVRRLVLAGSIEVPGPGDADIVPCSPYAASKQACLSYARMYHALYGTPVVVARMSMVYGPRQWDTSKLVPYVIGSLLNGERPKLSSGRRMIDWVYVCDVVAGLRAMAQTPGIEGRSIDLGSGKLTSIRDLVQELTSAMHSTIEPEYGAVSDRPMEPERAADVAETARLIGWSPATGLSEGLRQTVAWYRNQYPSTMAAAS